ncbi:MAG: hypothetical protein VX346_18845 [Planctomycetota bacterium]|nr:hypothetical protein [Planctomycetota bacterium]
MSPSAARALGARVPVTKHPSFIADPILGRRPRPNYNSHDHRGFRNPIALDQADVVCLGDSQTYGQGVACEDAWPTLLSSTISQSVYNMAFGGWGPTHSEALLEEVLKLKPQLVIAGLYSGNDFHDCYSMVYSHKQSPQHRTNDRSLAAQMTELDRSQPISSRQLLKEIKQLANYRSGFIPDARLSLLGWNLIDLRAGLSNHSRLYGLARGIKNALPSNSSGNGTHSLTTEDLWQTWRRKAAKSGGRWEICEEGNVRTVLTPHYRFQGLNMEDPRIQEGYRIAMAATIAMQHKLTTSEAVFLVVLIPTKILVFEPLVRSASSSFSKLVEHELRVWEATKNHLRENNIPYVDVLPALRKCLQKGQQPYPIGVDGHPNPQGHKVIAASVSRWIEENLDLSLNDHSQATAVMR